MRYFTIEMDKNVTHAPYIINWMKQVPPNLLTRHGQFSIPNRQILDLKPQKDTAFLPVLTTPFLLLSEEIYKILKIYEPNCKYRQMVLMDSKYNYAKLYYFPLLEEYDCLTDGTTYNFDKSDVLEGVLDESKIGDKCIFTLGNISSRKVVVRLDFLESILRRKAIITYQELRVKER